MCMCVCIIVSDLYSQSGKNVFVNFKLTGPRPRGYEFLFILQCVICINVSDEILY